VLAATRLDRAQLAYLSACDTALTSDLRLVDEAIHMASAFQLAGYPHVVATLWAINDKIAADIAAEFYREVMTGGGTVLAFAPTRALHKATRAARDRFRNAPSLWAAHIHTGA
jgi:CHAT domain-containing protein